MDHSLVYFFILCVAKLFMFDDAAKIRFQQNTVLSGVSGIIQVYHDGRWGTVCNDDWDMNEAKVACRQLGYSKVLGFLRYGTGEGPIWLDWLNCKGSETSLQSCPHAGWGKYMGECEEHVFDVGVMCSGYKGKQKVVVRMDNKDINVYRVEVRYHGMWRSICANNWDIHDADVVCRMQGYKKAAVATTTRITKEDSVWLDDVKCSGEEPNIKNCSYLVWNWENIPCSSKTLRAGVICYTDTPSLEFKITPNKQYFGILKVKYYDIWVSICASNLHLNEAHVICRMLGFAEAVTMSLWSKQSGLSFAMSLRCDGSETSTDECHDVGLKQVGSWRKTEVMGIVCKPLNIVQNETIDIRLVGGSNEGRVEVKLQGVWGTVCSSGWDRRDANVVCKIKGYAGAITAYKKFPEGSGPIWLTGLKCKGQETNLLDCGHDKLQNTSSCSHANDVGVVCYSKKGELQVSLEPLDNISSIYYGLVQIKFNNETGTIDGEEWDIQDAHVVCRMMHFKKALAAVSQFGRGSGKLVLSKVRCTGKETSLEMCDIHGGWEAHSQNNTYGAGVICERPSGTDVERRVRLVSENSTTQGRIEVHYYGVWGTLCNKGWDMADAHVACRMLGYDTASMVKVPFAKGRGPILFSDFQCQGNEESILNCPHTEAGIFCDHSRDVAVTCRKLTKDEASMTVNIIEEPLEDKGVILGQVEVKYNGSNFAVCDDSWDLLDANVICKTKGYKKGIAAIKRFKEDDRVDKWMTSVECSKRNKKINECYHSRSNSSRCPGHFRAGVMCKTFKGSIKPVRVRLRDGASKASGVVEVRYGNVWGTICNDGQKIENGHVICRMLGYFEAVSVGTSSKLKHEGGIIWLSGLDCYGSEDSIEKCKTQLNWGQTTCDHNKNTYVTCKKADAPRFQIISITESTATLVLSSLKQIKGHLQSSYQLAIERWRYEERLKSFIEEKPFEFEDENRTLITKEGSHSNFIVEVDGNTLSKNFTVGNGQKYEGFKNEPLDPNCPYRVYIRVVTKAMDQTRIYGHSSYVAFKTKPLPTIGKTEKIRSSGGNGAVIGLAIFLVILISLVCALVWYVWKQRKEHKSLAKKTQVLEMERQIERRAADDVTDDYYQSPMLRDGQNEYVTNENDGRYVQEGDDEMYVDVRR